MYNYKEDLSLSEGWKEQFDIFEKYGFFGNKDPEGFKTTSVWKRSSFNWLALLFGPFYFVAKGMYRIAATLIVLLVVIILSLSIIDSIFETKISDFWTGTSTGVVCAMLANYAYYNYKVKNYRGWNPFFGTNKNNP